jgi:hypothetical protein
LKQAIETAASQPLGIGRIAFPQDQRQGRALLPKRMLKPTTPPMDTPLKRSNGYTAAIGLGGINPIISREGGCLGNQAPIGI